jgi:hypothetical protein
MPSRRLAAPAGCSAFGPRRATGRPGWASTPSSAARAGSSRRHEGRAAAARLAAPAARARRALPHAPPLAGWADDGALRFDTPAGEQRVQADATVLALGGASWQRLGSDGAWVPLLAARGVDVAPLQPSNCGFDVGLERAPAQPPCRRAAEVGGHRWTGARRHAVRQAGEFVLTARRRRRQPDLRRVGGAARAIARDGQATFELDLLPARERRLGARELAHPRGPRSLSTHLKTRLKLDGVKAALLWEGLAREAMADPAALAARIKALPVTLRAAADRRGHQHRRRRALRRAGRRPDAARAARRVLRRRDARLGSADRRLPAHRLPGHRARGGAGRAALVARRGADPAFRWPVAHSAASFSRPAPGPPFPWTRSCCRSPPN